MWHMRFSATTCFISSMAGRYNKGYSHKLLFPFFRTTIYTEFTILQRVHSDVEERLVLDSFKYHHFLHAWYSFMHLLDVDYSHGFFCNTCGVNSNILIMDATCISFRRALDSWRLFVGNTPTTVTKSGR